MRWISKEPPLYAWDQDTWYNERDKCVYTCDLAKNCWCQIDDSSKVIPFPKKTKVMGHGKL